MSVGEPVRELDGRNAEESIAWIQGEFGERAVFACSFGAEDMVILDMIARTAPRPSHRIRVVTLDTGRLFEETYRLMQEARARFGVPIEVVFPDPKELEELVSRKGPNLFYESVENRKACCQVRKIQPLNRALREAEAWIVGLRREQSFDRSVVERLSRDGMHGGIWKVCPLSDWSWEDVLRYVRENNVPINPLHSRGFPSIGCAPCTRAVEPGADPRSGRWWWELGSKECGLHASLPPNVPADGIAAGPPNGRDGISPRADGRTMGEGRAEATGDRSLTPASR